MYHFIVQRKIRQGFQDLSSGNYRAVLKQFSPSVAFSFSGDHAIGGECHTLQQVTQWFERLYRLFPGIQFEVHHVTVSGWPWNTTATTQFTVRATLRDGRLYQNKGIQFLRLRWGRIVEDRLFEDTYKLVLELHQMGEQGVSEALAAPIAAASA